MASEEPVIAEPHICGPISVDDSFHSLILMSDGVYKALEDATETKAPNLDLVTMVTQELLQQSTLTGLAQAVVDKVGRLHHDAFMNQVKKCQKRDDMTVLVRIFSEEITSNMKSPRSAGKKHSNPGLPPMSPGVLPVSVPFNPASKDNSSPSLIIPSGVGSGGSEPQPQGFGEVDSRKLGTPSSTTSTPTNVISGPPSTVSSSSEPQSSPSSTSVSPSTAYPPKLTNQKPDQRTESKSKDEIDKACQGGDDEGDDNMIEPYVDFFKSCSPGMEGGDYWKSPT